ncbi:SGNH/GDSL hydrolase family protein [Rhodococcus opacus]|uniref:SGNH/GDSL hydrolase family protein n=1 Tax=Rhodococcus opacus TaxID=37919 RepID=UPI000EA85483|nr:SGNH/GDSL hydrolase family protein [Rhodococcus opacus]RKM72230.1 hypothetical protein COO55_09295 [Rhodococcus opacus]
MVARECCKRGAGFVAGGPEKVFAAQVEHAVWTQPDIIIVAGSRNDQYEPYKVRGAADTLFADLKAKAPQAQIVAIGPMWDNSAPSAGVVEADAAVRSAAEAAGIQFIEVLAEDWLGDPLLIQADGVHPTDIGQQVIAERVNATVPTVTLPR